MLDETYWIDRFADQILHEENIRTRKIYPLLYEKLAITS